MERSPWDPTGLGATAGWLPTTHPRARGGEEREEAHLERDGAPVAAELHGWTCPCLAQDEALSQPGVSLVI